MVWGLWKAAGPSPEEERARIQKDAEEKARKKKEEEDLLQSELLPWETKQKVEICLNIFKIPLIVFVIVLGSITENRLSNATIKTWISTAWTPTCYVHQLDLDTWSNSAFNISIGSIAHFVNDSLANSTWCKTSEDGTVKCDIIDTAWWGYNLTWEEDHCGIMERMVKQNSEEEEECTVDQKKLVLQASTQAEVGAGGMSRRFQGVTGILSHLTRSMVWGFYKLIFLPFNPLDRIVKFFSNRERPPEPVFKLLTEPYFKVTPMAVLVSIIKYFRYTALPNSLILPLRTLSLNVNCPMLFHYKIDTWVGFNIYVYVIYEMIAAFGLYILGKTWFGSKLVGSRSYKIYQCYWLTTAWIGISLFIIDVWSTFNWRFWIGWDIVIRKAIKFNLNLRFEVDMMQTLASIVVFLDVVSLLVLILSLVCPKLLEKLGSKLPGAGMYQGLTSGDKDTVRLPDRVAPE